MSADFLLELRSEEIPARMQAAARNELARMFAAELDRAGLRADAIDVWSTPRRLALIARGLPLETQATSEELKGPRTSAPEQALAGFLRKTGLAREQLEDRAGTWFAVIDKPGRPTLEILGEAIERIVRTFSWPKSMRWGAASSSTSSLRWVRPLQGIVAMLGEEIVPVGIDGIASGATTLGHRFHHPGPITIGGADDYAEKLRACHVIVDQEERERIVREGAAAAAIAAGLSLIEEEALVVENAGLTEWPVPLLGRFDADYLDVPREVIVLTMRTNQKYFACTGDDGGLAPAFVCVANISADDGGEAIVEGNKRVLAARLSDARFFWEQDLKVPLEEQTAKLSGIVFHEKLGTIADKVERVAKLARWLVEEGIIPLPSGEGGAPLGAEGEGDSNAHPHPSAAAAAPSLSHGEREKLATHAERAARLAKADLVTGMVGEFPELQGVIGGYIAERQGEPKAVADAIRDHYKPVGQGDDVPTAPVTVAVALADKLDTLLGFFANKFYPTGSRDPFALRRAALSSMRLILTNNVRLHLNNLFSDLIGNFFVPIPDPSRPEPDIIDIPELMRDPNIRFNHEPGRTLITRGDLPLLILQGEFESLEDWDERTKSVWDGEEKLLDFITERMRVSLVDRGFRHDYINAVISTQDPFKPAGLQNYEYDAVRLLARVRALQAFVETAEGGDLLTAYKRAANILRKEDWVGPSVMTSAAEQGIPQTGEEDPLVLVEEPAIAAAVAEMASGSAGADLQPEEQALIAALDQAEPKARTAVEEEDFTAAMAALASLRGPIDAFFDHVTVNADQAEVRARRLNLLLRFRDAVNQVADFSRIEG